MKFCKEKMKKLILSQRGSLHDNCPTCGTQFEVKNLQHKFCSAECRPSGKSGKSGRWTVLHRDNFRCIYCGRAPWNTPDLVMHVDHIHPHAAGGKDILGTLVTSCSECNCDKRATKLKNEKEIKKIVEQRNTEQQLNPKRLVKFHR